MLLEMARWMSRCVISILCLFEFSKISSAFDTVEIDAENIEQGRQLLLDFYSNYTSSSTPLTNPVDLVFVLDRSASVTRAGWGSMVRFVHNLLEHFTVDAHNTRVAVITYGTTASVDIDGIRAGDYNKCALVARLQKHLSKKVPSGYSATHDAIMKAKEVVVDSRKEAKKAVVVITDGRSNIGPPPVRASVQLRSLVWDTEWDTLNNGPQLQIYAFGIKDAYMPEVRTIASPLPNHTFYIPSFQTFSELARSLHDDSQSENWQVLGDKGYCQQEVGCSEHAYCACGTRSGLYLCVCKDGYHGDGTSCAACPRGTYKNRISPVRCFPCPANSTTLYEGATDPLQCVCEAPLYQESSGSPCHVRFCIPLPPITHGQTFHVPGRVVDEVSPTGVACTNTPDTSCHYRCDDGYRLNGHPGLICNPNGTWEGSVPECEIVNCSTLEFHHQDVQNGDVQYLNKTTTYGSILQVHCHEGYRAFGDWERTCTLHGTWSGTRTWCVENKCPALQVTPGLIITPVICGQSALTPGSVCQFICEKGYSLIGPSNVTCNDKGAWNGASQTECIDIEAPEIVCPEDITTPITEANYALVHLKVSSLRVTDNSNEFTVEVVGGVNESVRLTAGVHQFKYIARDKAGKEGHCFQTITVVDSVFRLVKCPEQNISIHMNQHLAEANWPEVVFMDHNNLMVEHACAPANNSLLPPGKYTVQCTPAAHTISKVMCEFQVLLYQPQCVVPKAPLHGSLTCSPTQTSLLTCQVKCNDNYDFHSLPQSHYICDLQGIWNLKIPNLFWPDCTRKFLPGRALLRGQARFFYYRGRCEDTRTQIAQTFTDFLQTHSWNVCGQELCSIEEVKVHCGSESKRKKREEDIFLGTLKLANAKLSHRRQIRESKMMSSANKTGVIDGVDIISKKLSNDVQGNSTDIYRELFRIPDEETKKTQKDNPDDVEKSAGKSFGKPGFGGGEILQEQDETSTQVFTLNKRQENSEDQFGFLDRSGAGPYGDDVLEEADSMYDVDRLTNMTQSGLLDGYNSTISDMNPDDVTWLQGSDGKEKVTITFQIISKVPPGHPVTTNAQSDMVQHLYDVSDTLTSAWQALNLTVPTNATGHIGNHTFENGTFGILSDIHQMSMDEPLIQSCPEGFVSHSEIHGSTLTCMACPRGTYHDRVLDICDVCPDHEYQPEEAQLTCLSCPDDTYTPHRGADNISLCLASCKPGEYSINGLVPCIPCPRHTFISMSQSKTCLPCLHNRKTLQIGSTSPSQCIDLCGPGNFSDTGLVPCQPCPKGSYSPELGAITCFLCDEGQSTLELGSVDKSSCIEWDPCLETSLVCENNGTCKKNSLTAVCECPSGFTGDRCEINIEDCWESLCHNEATCVDGVNSFTCVCTPGHTGRYCEVGIDECLSSPCQNGGSCLDKINDYQCFCPTGYTGKQCNVTIPPCTKEICVHGTCQIMAVDDIRCVCNSGYAGPSCNVTYDLCSSHPCVHAYDCLDSPGNYTCSCRPGYTGRLCDVAINHCSPSPCLPHSACISLTSSYYCKCPGGWSGKHCDNETTADFDLIFNPSSLEGHYVVIPSSFMPTLQAFTLSTWLRPGLLSAFATIVTFVLPQHGSVEKNDDSDYEVVFALQHTDKLIVRLYGESFFTNASLPPSVWTHLCFTWSSATGRWSVSVNGSLVSSDRVTAPFRPIPAQVITVIGQQNPFYGETSLMWDVFSGEMTQFNIFGRALSIGDIISLANQSACNQTYGDVVTWTDVIGNAKEGTIIRLTSHCMDVNECLFPDVFPCSRNRVCYDGVGGYNCSDCIEGYKGPDCSEPDDECLLDDKCFAGTCVDGPELYDYRCICNPGYTGVTCSVRIDECLSNPCRNGGICNLTETSFTCMCPGPNMGSLCERPFSPCLHNPCHNNGVCSDAGPDGYTCVCREHFAGRNCERQLSWCEENACLNGGTCVNASSPEADQTGSTSSCLCLAGWTGKQCGVKVIPSCELSPCVDGGTCISVLNSIYGYICRCPHRLGVTLDRNCAVVNPCESSPCPATHVCVAQDETYTCSCIKQECLPWYGPNNTTADSAVDKMDPGKQYWWSSDWTFATIASSCVFLVAILVLTVYLCRRKKSSSGDLQALNSSPDVALEQMTNPGFQHDEAESTYAELSDDYNVPDRDDDYDDQVYQPSTLTSISSIRKAPASRTSSSSSSGSLGSLRSSLSKKFQKTNETNTPLLSDDYLEPIVVRKDTASPHYVSHTLKLDHNFAPEQAPNSGVLNVGFNPEDYIIPDRDRHKSPKLAEENVINKSDSEDHNKEDYIAMGNYKVPSELHASGNSSPSTNKTDKPKNIYVNLKSVPASNLPKRARPVIDYGQNSSAVSSSAALQVPVNIHLMSHPGGPPLQTYVPFSDVAGQNGRHLDKTESLKVVQKNSESLAPCAENLRSKDNVGRSPVVNPLHSTLMASDPCDTQLYTDSAEAIKLSDPDPSPAPSEFVLEDFSSRLPRSAKEKKKKRDAKKTVLQDFSTKKSRPKKDNPLFLSSDKSQLSGFTHPTKSSLKQEEMKSSSASNATSGDGNPSLQNIQKRQLPPLPQ